MTEFEDFKPFFEAMIAKMKSHDHDRGESWKDEYWYKDVARSAGEYHEVRMDVTELLVDRLSREFREYKESSDPKELIDIANFCAMLYLRACSEKATGVEG